MCVTCITPRGAKDKWSVHETLKLARAAYKKALGLPHFYCACIALMKEGTDWPADTK